MEKWLLESLLYHPIESAVVTIAVAIVYFGTLHYIEKRWIK